MSPIGDAFRNRLRKFPSLVNCCTIDWFQVIMLQGLIVVSGIFSLIHVIHSTILDKSPWHNNAVFVIICTFWVLSQKKCILFVIVLQFSLPPPYTKLKLGKNSGYTLPTLFVGWGEGLGLCEFENATEMKEHATESVPRLSSIVVVFPYGFRSICQYVETWYVRYD